MNKKLLIPVIIAAVLLVAAIVVFIILGLPRVKLGLLLNSFPDEVSSFFKAENDFSDLIGEQSHSAEAEVSVESDFLDLSVDFITAYDNATGDGAMEVKSDYADVGLYLEGDEVAFVVDTADIDFGIDTQNDFDLVKGMTLKQRLVNLPLNHQNDKEMRVYLDGLESKIKDYAMLAIKTLPKESLSKNKENIDLFSKSTKTKFIEIAMDTDTMIDFMEVILDEMEQDDELEEMFVGLLDYIADKYDFDSDLIDTDDIDLNDAINDALDNLDDLEADDFILKVYFQGNTMLGFATEYTDSWDDDIEFSLILANKGKDKSLTMAADNSYNKMDLVFQKAGGNTLFEFDDGDTKAEFTIEGKGKEKDISGQFESWNEEFDFDGTYVEESDGYMVELDSDYFTAEYLFVEERKNKEYHTELTVDIDGQADINFEQVLMVGEDVDEPDIASWSNNYVFTYDELLSGTANIDDLVYDLQWELEDLIYGGY